MKVLIKPRDQKDVYIPPTQRTVKGMCMVFCFVVRKNQKETSFDQASAIGFTSGQWRCVDLLHPLEGKKINGKIPTSSGNDRAVNSVTSMPIHALHFMGQKRILFLFGVSFWTGLGLSRLSSQIKQVGCVKKGIMLPFREYHPSLDPFMGIPIEKKQPEFVRCCHWLSTKKMGFPFW